MLVTIPKLIHAQIMSAYREPQYLPLWPGFFPIQKEGANAWLTKHLSITADCSEETVEGFTFRFNHVTGKWYVK
jgi:hypothetical protein